MSLTGFYRLIYHTYDIQESYDDIFIGAKQASQYVIGTECVSMDDTYTYLNHDGKEMNLLFDRERLVKSDGYEILIHDLDDVKFYQQDDLIYMDVTRGDNKFSFLLTYYFEAEKGEEENDEEIEQ